MYSIFVLFLFRIMEILPKMRGKKPTNRKTNSRPVHMDGWATSELPSNFQVEKQDIDIDIRHPNMILKWGGFHSKGQTFFVSGIRAMHEKNLNTYCPLFDGPAILSWLHKRSFEFVQQVFRNCYRSSDIWERFC